MSNEIFVAPYTTNRAHSPLAERVIHLEDVVNETIVGKCLAINGEQKKEAPARFLLGPAPFDNQVNGTSDGHREHVLLTNTPTPDTLRTMARHMLLTGTTRFLPTIITSEFGRFIEALEALKKIPPEERKALGIEGLHVEGRWIDVEKKGIHNPNHIAGKMTDTECEFLCGYGKEGVLRMVTISPTKVTLEQIKQLKAAGIVVSVGHSTATFDQMREAVQAGVRHITHLGNRTSGEIVPRDGDLGILGYALAANGNTAGIPRIVSSLVCDDVHVRDHFFQLIMATHGGAGEMALTRVDITSDDATCPGDESYSFPFGPGGMQVYYDHTKNICSDGETTLGGASTTMGAGIMRAHRLGVSARNAIHMASGVFDGVLGNSQKDIGPSLDHMALYDAKTLQIVACFRERVRATTEEGTSYVLHTVNNTQLKDLIG